MRRGEIRQELRFIALRLIIRDERRLGLTLGYLSCCVDSFIEAGGCAFGQGIAIPPEWDGSGYVPCQNCAQINPVDLWRDIMARRRINGVRIRLRYPRTANR
jgi:hypothetical protein